MAKRKRLEPEPDSKNTNLRLEWRSPAELAENPANWRRHPDKVGHQLGCEMSRGYCLPTQRRVRLVRNIRNRDFGPSGSI